MSFWGVVVTTVTEVAVGVGVFTGGVLGGIEAADNYLDRFETKNNQVDEDALLEYLGADPTRGYYIYLEDGTVIHYPKKPDWAGSDWDQYAVPAKDLKGAIPSNAIPSNGIPSNGIPSNQVPVHIVLSQLLGNEISSVNNLPINLLPQWGIPSNDTLDAVDLSNAHWLTPPEDSTGSEMVAGGIATTTPYTPYVGSEMAVFDPCLETFSDITVYTGNAEDPSLTINIIKESGFVFETYDLHVGVGRIFSCSLFDETRLICSGPHLPSGINSVTVVLYPADKTCPLLNTAVTLPVSSSSSSSSGGSEVSCPSGEEYHPGSGCCTIGCWCDYSDWGWGCWNECPGCPP